MKFNYLGIVKVAKTAVVLVAALFGFSAALSAQQISFDYSDHALALVQEGVAVPIVVDPADEAAVRRAVGDFQADIERVSGVRPAVTPAADAPELVVVGTIGSSRVVDELIEAGVLDVSDVQGRWEAYVIELLDDPLPGVDQALVIAGSDRRGTIYGMFELSRQMGVSPWYWWADVPVTAQDEIYILPGRVVDAPAVQYRGIFLNDEAPALSGWANEQFGGFNHKFYSRVFELMLRLRANYLWPAMWGSAFADDDPLNAVVADEYGIVIGTSHHEPLMRAHAEWGRYGKGPWDYSRNGEVLRDFWRGGVERVKDFENIVTLGMRGDGDEAMSEDTNVALLERIVDDQRGILEDIFERPVEEVPQVWALYKEVQDYYENGMRVPDDVILLWADDNWGNIRRLPTEEERQRRGGAGVYYHFDYVGGPRSYKWMNVTPISKIWEQMHLAWEYGAHRIWIVNVGDLKPMEFPISFFLDYAWDPEAIAYDDLHAWSVQWATANFGDTRAEDVAALINGYSRLNRRRTPELLAPDTLSLVNYNEAERVLEEWDDLVERAEAVNRDLPEAFRSAFFQLVIYPVKASATVQRLYVEAGYNRLYAAQGRVETNEKASAVRELFQQDDALAQQYHSINGGKWNHMMSQVNIGYRIWQQPLVESMPALTEVRPHAGAVPAIALEGNIASWPDTYTPEAKLPTLDVFSQSSRWIDLFNRGLTPFQFSVQTDQPWLRVTPAKGQVEKGLRLSVEADWPRIPADAETATITIRAGDQTFSVKVPILNPAQPEHLEGFVETDGFVSIEAPHFHRKVAGAPYQWQVLEDFGRTSGAVAISPVTADEIAPGGDSPRLEYDLHLFTSGEVTAYLHFAPSLDFQPGEGLRFGISLNNSEPQILKLGTWETLRTWEESVAGNVRVVSVPLHVDQAGLNTLKYWYVTPGVVLEKIVLDTGGLRPSYLGPQESPRGPAPAR